MVAKFHDNNNGYSLRACMRKHSRSKFGLVWVGVWVCCRRTVNKRRRRIRQTDDDDDDDSIEHWLLVPEEKGRGGWRRVKKSALRSPPRRMTERMRMMMGRCRRWKSGGCFLARRSDAISRSPRDEDDDDDGLRSPRLKYYIYIYTTVL